MRVISSQIMKDYWYLCNLWTNLQFEITSIMSRSTILSCNMTMITNRIFIKLFSLCFFTSKAILLLNGVTSWFYSRTNKFR